MKRSFHKFKDATSSLAGPIYIDILQIESLAIVYMVNIRTSVNSTAIKVAMRSGAHHQIIGDQHLIDQMLADIVFEENRRHD